MIDLSFIQHLSPAAQRKLLEGPALDPPEGAIHNLNNPPNRDDLGYAVLVTVASITTVLVFLRLYSRVTIQKQVAIEDCLSVAALGVFGVYIYFSWQRILTTGLFVHQWNVRLGDTPTYFYYVNAASIVYGNVIMLLKAGILLQWTHIFIPRGTRNAFWWTCQIVLWTNVVFYVICTFIEIFGCTPRERLWNMMISGTCLDMPSVTIATGIVNFLSDVVILLLPQRIIWTLNMSAARRISIASIFTIGIFAAVCAAFRVKSAFDYAHDADKTYTTSVLGLWCVTEMTAGFSVLCLPAVPKIFAESLTMRRMVSYLRGSTGSESSPSKDRPEQSSISWPRFRPNTANASLFTDSDERGFVHLSNVDAKSETALSAHAVSRQESNHSMSQHDRGY